MRKEVSVASAVVLAAGASSRMGHPKALLPMGSQKLLEAHLSVLTTHCAEVVVVGGALKEEIALICRAFGAHFVHNADWATTMPVDSLRCALSLEISVPCVVTPVDTPPVLARDLSLLLSLGEPAVLGYQGQRGHPVVLGEDQVRQLRGEGGPGHLGLLMEDACVVESQSADCLLNFNHPENWKAWLDG